MIIKVIIYSLIAGINIFLGGILANYFNHHIKETPVKYEIIHTLMSFGVGIILSALVLVLIPKGLENLNIFLIILSFGLGTITFFLIDKGLSNKSGNIATLMAMLMDFIPESIILGAIFIIEPNTALLLSIVIGIQNIPESFNSFRDLVLSGYSSKKTLIIFFFMSFLGVIGALFGYLILSNHEKVTSLIMLFASGGILYLLIQDIIPETKLEKHYFTSLGASAGFLVGVIAEKMI